MVVLTIGAIKYIDKIKEQIDIELKKITQKELIPAYSFHKKGDINFLIFEIKDSELLKDHSSFYRMVLNIMLAVITNVILKYTDLIL